MKEKFSVRPIRKPIQPDRQLDQVSKFLPGEILQEQMPRVMRPVDINELTPDERAEMIADSMFANEIDKERQKTQLRIYGKTDKQIEAEADAFLRTAQLRDRLNRKRNR